MNAKTKRILRNTALAGLSIACVHSAWAAPRQVNINVQNGSSAKAHKDSLAMADKAVRDSMAISGKVKQDSLSMADKARKDSATMAEMARRDSLLLSEANQQLSEERAKRTEMENQLLTTGMLVMDAVYFETGRTEISLNSRPYLDILAKMLTKYPKLQIEEAGHTDNVGSEASNQALSDGRAAAVKDYLINRAPELGNRLTSKGYGETAAKADNRTADGRKLNRRTELQVLNKEALREYAQPSPAQTSQSGGTGTIPSGRAAGTGDTSAPAANVPQDTLNSR